MTEETLALSDAPEPIETEDEVVTADVEAIETEEVETEQMGEQPSESSTETEEKAEKPNPAQKRIDELTKARRTAERDAEYWRDQAQRKEPDKPVEKVAEPLKTLEDFDYDEAKYQQHLFSKAREGAVDEAKRVLKDEQGRENSDRRISTFRGKEADFSKSVDDYHEVVTDPNLPISQVMADVATEMDNGPEVLYYLGKNPDLADKISQLSPLSAARELGRIEATIQSQEKKGETVSKAPAPAPKIKAANPAIQKSMDDMSQREFNDYRRKQIANRGR